VQRGGCLLAFAYGFGDSFSQANLGQLFPPLGCLLNDDAIVDLVRLRTTHPLQSLFVTERDLIPLPWAANCIERIAWRYMATFGQKIPTALITYPSLGFYNFHHSADTWPSYAGPDPIAAMVRDGRKHLVLTIHKATDVIDGGAFVAHSHPVGSPEGINAGGCTASHGRTWDRSSDAKSVPC